MSVLFTNQAGTAIAAAHAGWRGLCKGVLENTVTLFLQEQAEVANQLIAWIGPSISAPHYEVGSEVRDAFLREGEQRGHALSEFCFEKSVNAQHYMADLPRIAKERLNAMGVEAVYGGDLCTYSNPERFYSYRRQNPTGRFASLIWFNPRP